MKQQQQPLNCVRYRPTSTSVFFYFYLAITTDNPFLCALYQERGMIHANLAKRTQNEVGSIMIIKLINSYYLFRPLQNATANGHSISMVN